MPKDSKDDLVQFLKVQDRVQKDLEATYALAAQSEMRIWLYFPNQDFHSQLFSIRMEFQEKINKATAILKEGGKPAPFFSEPDFSKIKLKTNSLLDGMRSQTSLPDAN